MIHTIYTLALITFYYAYAGPFGYIAGGRLMLWHSLLFTAVCVVAGKKAFSSANNPKKPRGLMMRTIHYTICRWILPGILLLLLLLSGRTADRVLLLPPLILLLLTILGNNYRPDYYRLVTVFDLHWKALLPYLVFGTIILGKDAILYAFLPLAALSALTQIAGMRILRHDPVMAQQRTVQKDAILPLLPMAAFAFLLAFWGQNQPIGEAAVGFYRGVIAPLLTPLAYLMTFIGTYLIYPLSRLWLKLLGFMQWREAAPSAEMAEEADDKIGEMISSMSGNDALLRMMAIGLILLLVLLLVWIGWHFLRGTSRANESGEYLSSTRTTLTEPSEPVEDQVQKVREIYRRYLRRIKKQGTVISRSDTSAELLRKRHHAEDEAALRELYLKARYQEQADGADIAEARRLSEKLL